LRNGKNIHLPTFSVDTLVEFIGNFDKHDLLLKKDMIMNPLPPEIGQLNFCIVRDKSMVNRMTPAYCLYLENGGNKTMVLHAKKKMLAMNGYYLITIEPKRNTKRTSNVCLGKLRALASTKDKYTLYDNGESYNSKKLF